MDFDANPEASPPAPKTFGVVSFLKSKVTGGNLAAAGTAVILSYGFVSNINSCTMLAWTWAKYVKDTGLSPVVAMHPPFFTKKFFAYYGAIYLTLGTALRPIRVVLAGAISPAFNRALATLEMRFRFPKPLAVLAMVFTFNVVLTIAWLFLNLKVAFWVLGVPAGVASTAI
jgi:hypothetical protein